MARIKKMDLMKLPHENPLWREIIKMTIPKSPYYTEAACNMLRRLRREIAGRHAGQKRFSKAIAILLAEDGEIMAHNIIMKDDRFPHMILYAFTKRAYRKMGCQKRLLKYTSKRYRSLYFWTDNKARERTFSYYKGHKAKD